MKYYITEDDIKNIIKESVNTILNETRGVNDELEAAADLLVRNISANITKSEIHHDKYSGLDFYFMDTTITLYGQKTSWLIKAYIFPETDKYDDVIQEYPWINDCQSTSDGEAIFWGRVSFPIIGKWIPKFQLSDGIYHEMLHLLKSMKAKKNVGNEIFNAKAADTYYKGNELEKDLGLVAYISREDEQDAYVNGLYGQMKAEFLNNQNIDIRDAFYESDLYKKYVELCQAEERLLNVRGTDELSALINKWNIKDENGNYVTYWNEKKVFNLIKQAKQRLEKKTALVIRRFESQLYKYMGLKTRCPNNLFNL